MTRGSFGSGRLETTESGLKRAYQIAKEREKKRKKQEGWTERRLSQRDIELEIEKRREARKAADLQYKKEQSAKKGDSTSEKSAEVITSRDTDPTATQKSLSNVARLIKSGAKGVARHLLKKADERKKAKDEREAALAQADVDKQQIEKEMKQKRLPPAPEGAFERGDKTRINPPGSSRPIHPTPKPFRAGQRIRGSRRLLSPNVVGRKVGGSMVGASNSNANTQTSEPKTVTLGQRARKNIGLRNKLLSQRGGTPSTNEEVIYSCWREEFLFELGTIRKKTKDKKNNEDEPVDVMSGVNNITISPSVSERFNYSELSEDMNGASIFAKATPPLKRRTTPMSDIHLSKQPGKGSAERVEKLMRKLFLGDRGNFYANYDLSGHKSDDNDVKGNKYSDQTEANESYHNFMDLRQRKKIY